LDILVATEKTFYVYILTSKRNGTLYIGITSDLEQRIWDHKHDTFDGFTKRRKIHLLVYYEDGGNAMNAIQRETQLKKWNCAWKIRLIEKYNPHWQDLYDDEKGILLLPLE
jgi:putative endonuclease